MIKNEIDRLEELQGLSQISPEEFNEWKNLKITKRFFVDVEIIYYGFLDEIVNGGVGSDLSIGATSAIEGVIDHMPDEVVKELFNRQEGKEKDDIQK